jgi:hypothetical protein
MTEKPKKSFAAFEQQNSVPSAFASTVKDTNKLGARKFAPTKQYIKPDINIGSKIAGKDSDLEGLGDVVNKVKKEHVEIGPGVIRKFKMTKQLSGRFTQEARREEAMEMHKQKQEEAKRKKEEEEAMANMPLAERRAYEAGKRADEDAKKRAGRIAFNISPRNNTFRSPKSKLGRNKSGGREKLNILALVDDAIENDPSEEAKKKAAALKAAADAPILLSPRKSTKKKNKEREKPNILAMVNDAVDNNPPTPIEEAAVAKKAAESAPILPPQIKPDKPEPPVRTKSSDILSDVDFVSENSPPIQVLEATAAKKTVEEALVPPKIEAVPFLFSSAPKAVVVKVTPAPKNEVTPEPKGERKAEPKTPINTFTPTKSPKPRVTPIKVEAVPSLLSSPKAVVKVTPAPKNEVTPEPKEERKAEPNTPINTFTPTKSPKPRVAPPKKVEAVPSLLSSPKAEVKVTPAPKNEVTPEPKEERKVEPNTPINTFTPTKSPKPRVTPIKVEAVPSLLSSPKAEVKVTPAPENEVTPEPKEEPKAERNTPINTFTPTKSPKPRVAPPKKVEAAPSLFSSVPNAVVKVTPVPKTEATPEPKEEPKAEPKTPINTFTPTKSPKPRVAPPKVEAAPSLFSSAPDAAVKVTPVPKTEATPEPKEEPKAEPKTTIKSVTPTKSPKPRFTPSMSDDNSESSHVEVQSSLDFGEALSPNGHGNTMLSPNGYQKVVKTFKLSTSKPRPFIDIEKDKETPHVYGSIYNRAEELRTTLAEVECRLESCRIDGAVELEAWEKKKVSEKIQLSKEIGRQIRQHKVVNEKQAKSDQKAVDEEKEIVEKLREENKRLRATVEKYPYQMAELMASSESLQKANEEVAGHFKKLNEFTKKLQSDHDRLKESNAQCRNKFLPRYRQELYERKYYSEGETKIKVLYRNCMLKIAQHVEKSRQPKLWEDINIFVIETEGDVNPKFDPRHLFAAESDSSSSDSSDSDDSDSESD